MWLLDTHRAELHFFPTPESVPGGYAILSHCWDKDEQTFQDVREINARYSEEDGRNPRDFVSSKIREFCVLAELQGYGWGWADTCCIDKLSSAELSEAIKSMFRYYSLAGVCYAFLNDIPTGCDLRQKDSEFKHSRWHKRGWTLQELIAPEKVVFLSQDWEPLGTKHSHAATLAQITRIPVPVLTSMKTGLPKTCMATRLSWAAGRQTTRPEDEAYCLLGILDVDMYTSYGEGRQAFYRLQEEIIKRSTDTSLFVWGNWYQPSLGINDTLVRLYTHAVEATDHLHSFESFLFSPEPSEFTLNGIKRGFSGSLVEWHGGDHAQAGFTLITSSADDSDNGGFSDTISRHSTFSLTPYGIHAHFLVANYYRGGLIVAFLACSVDGTQVGLILNKCSDDGATAPIHPLYDIGAGGARLVKFTNNDLNGGLPFQWKEIYIRARPQDSITFHALWSRHADLETRALLPFHLSDRLRDTYDVRLVPVVNPYESISPTGSLHVHKSPNLSETFVFYSLGASTRIRDPFMVHLGVCALTSDPEGLIPWWRCPYALWAKTSSMHEYPRSRLAGPVKHICKVDHLDHWENKYQKAFTIAFPGTPGTSLIVKSVLLKFTPPLAHRGFHTRAITRVGQTGPWDLALEIITEAGDLESPIIDAPTRVPNNSPATTPERSVQPPPLTLDLGNAFETELDSRQPPGSPSRLYTISEEKSEVDEDELNGRTLPLPPIPQQPSPISTEPDLIPDTSIPTEKTRTHQGFRVVAWCRRSWRRVVGVLRVPARKHT